MSTATFRFTPPALPYFPALNSLPGESLNGARILFLENHPEAALHEAVQYFAKLRRAIPADLWKETTATFQQDPLHDIFCECPLQRRAYQKPRGYAGDAPMLDFIYGLTPAPAGTSTIGRRLFEQGLKSASCQSVRARKEILAEIIDETAAKVSRPRILSVACGHLREGLDSQALRSGHVGELIALDQDAESLDLVRREYAGMPVTPFHGSARGILSRKVAFSGLDLIYSAGLYDYLSDPVATRLNQTLFEMLLPGGKLLIANFAPNLVDIGFMEASMDWWLIYRDERGCADMMSAIDARHPRRYFRDWPGNVVFVEVTKRA
jgi:SAM-dependent methyltransferase